MPASASTESADLAEDADLASQEAADREAATERWADEFGVYRRASTVDSHSQESELGDITVTYTSDVTPVDDVSRILPNGEVEVSGSFEAEAELSVAAYANSGSGWTNAGNACQSREKNSTGFIDGCYRIYLETNDGDASNRYWAWNQYATAKSTGIFTLLTAWGESSNANSTKWSWVDWSPRSDADRGKCTSVSVGVSHVTSVSASFDACDKWDITKYSAAGQFKNAWKGMAWRSERDVAHMTLIKVANGKTPKWVFDHGFTAG